MKRYLAQRVFWAVPTVLGAVTLAFLVMTIVPGDAAQLILGQEGAGYSQPQLDSLRTQLGLDRPLHQQYLSWMKGAVTLDFGQSLWTGQSVIREISLRLPVTLNLIVLTLLISISLAIPIGVVSATQNGSFVDLLFRVLAIIGLSTPSFWSGLLLLMFLLVAFGWSPPVTYATVFNLPLQAQMHLLVPAITLALRQSGVAARMMRSSMLEVLREDYIRTGRAKGLREQTVTYRHALKNALIPLLSIMSVETITLFSGTVIIERIFNVPGIGTLLIDAAFHRDLPLLQGIIMIVVLFVLLVNLIADVSYAVIDPRVRYG